MISNLEICTWFEKHGVEKVHAQHLGGGFKYPFGYLKLTFALHGSMFPDGDDGGNPSGFLLTTNDGKKILKRVREAQEAIELQRRRLGR